MFTLLQMLSPEMYINRSLNQRKYYAKPKYLVLQPLSDIFFSCNNLGDETDFMATINESPSNSSLRYLSDKILLPFELTLIISMDVMV